MCEFIMGVLSGVITSIILSGGKRMIETPKLIISGNWKEKKWVGFEVRKNYGSTDIASDIIGHGNDFNIYGITIENKHQKIIVRKPAEITSTTIDIFDKDGNKVIDNKSCRWWSHDLSELDNLFVPKEYIDINTRREQIISDGESLGLAIYLMIDGSSNPYLFAIDSDRQSKFLDKDNLFKGHPPYYAKLLINGKNFHEEFNLQIMDENISPVFKEIENFPFFDKE